MTAFSKTVSEDLMHVSLIFKLESSTFHKKKSHSECSSYLVCVGKGSAVTL